MSSTSTPVSNPTSIPWNNYINTQSFNVTGLDGTPVTLSFTEIDQLSQSYTTDGIVNGFTIGFCSMLLIVLFLITPHKRRRRPILLLNVCSLFLLIVKSICICISDNASYSGVGPQLLGAFYAYDKTTWIPIVIESVLSPFLYVSIMTSLLLQVRVVFSAVPVTRRIITGIGIVAMLVEAGLSIANSVYGILVQYGFPEFIVVPEWLYRTMRLYFLIFVSISCLCFLYKLALTIYRRQKMGINIKRLGPMQIIFITSTQCLIVPSTILIYQLS